MQKNSSMTPTIIVMTFKEDHGLLKKLNMDMTNAQDIKEIQMNCFTTRKITPINLRNETLTTCTAAIN